MTEKNTLVSAIISSYNSEKFIQGRIVDLLEQTISDQLQIIIVNSGSMQNEEKLIQLYLRDYKKILHKNFPELIFIFRHCFRNNLLKREFKYETL